MTRLPNATDNNYWSLAVINVIKKHIKIIRFLIVFGTGMFINFELFISLGLIIFLNFYASAISLIEWL